MTWKIEFTQFADRQLRKIDRVWQAKLLNYLAKITDPYAVGKPLSGNKKGLWRYRVGDYRLVCQIKNNTLTVLVLTVGHRSKVYS